MILVIDNYDSFTYNLVQYIGTLHDDIQVHRNDKITLDDIRDKSPEKIVISPGPGRPEDAGISEEVIVQLGTEIPVLGICLGHQAIGRIFGGNVIQAPTIMHGKTSKIRHKGDSLFRELPNLFNATRYHSLIVERETLPDMLQVTAETEDGIIMGLRHREYPITGVQFHPESIVTEHGMQIIKNFIGDDE